MTNKDSGTGDILSPELIDKQSFDDCSQWTYDRRYFWDGALTEQQSLVSWGAQTAQYFLLVFLKRGGKYVLQPMALFDAPEPTFVSVFTSGNIIDDTFEFSHVDLSDRVPPKVSVRWRAEAASNDITNARALFPQIQEVTVYETGLASSTGALQGF